MSMLEIIDMTIWPLAYQSVFLGIIFELSRIQKEGNATESVTWHFEGDGMSSYRDMVGYRASSITIQDPSIDQIKPEQETPNLSPSQSHSNSLVLPLTE